MPDARISELPPATTLADADFAPMVQGTGSGAETRRATFAQLRTGILAERPIHVRDYGAVGNGTADDTAAIQSALNAAATAGGGTVLLGPRRYLVDSAELVIPSNVTLSGSMDPGGFRVNADFSQLPYCIVLNAARTIRLRRNAAVERVAIIRKGFVAPTSLRTALDCAAAFAGTAVQIGDGSTGNSTTSGTDSALRHLLIIGFAQGIRSDGSSRTRITDILGDCTNGLYLGKSYDIAQNERINWHPLATAGRTFSAQTYGVSGCTNNGSGLVRLTLSGAHELQVGDLLIVRGVGGVPGANGRFTVGAVPAAAQVDLAGTTFSGAYTSGGTADPGVPIRRGKAFHVVDADMPNFSGCFEFGHETGWHLDNLCHAAQLVNCGLDGGGLDPNSVGLRISGLANRNKWSGGFWSSKGRALVVESTAVDHNTIQGVMLTNGNGRSVEVTDGAVMIVGCDIYGQVYLGDAADSVQIIGCDAKGATFAGQSATALSRLQVVGSRLAAGAGVSRVVGGQAELASISSAGTVETRLSARGDGAVALHRRSASAGAALRLNDLSDAHAATIAMAGEDVVIETRVGGTVSERLRLIAGGTLALGGEPTAAHHAATRNYVDTQFTARPLVTVARAGGTGLSLANHNARMIVANPGTTLSVDWANVGHGFSCMVVNRTGGDLAISLAGFSAGIANADGNAKIKAGGIASLFAYSPDGGTTKLLHLAGSGAP